MKLSDVEFQGDGKKATFYYTADKRVDFRQLIKIWPVPFPFVLKCVKLDCDRKLRVWEALDLVDGSCVVRLGLPIFEPSNTAAARYQQTFFKSSKTSRSMWTTQMLFELRIGGYRSALKAFPKQRSNFKPKKELAFSKRWIFLRD